jgi:dienelactone hydrolase
MAQAVPPAPLFPVTRSSATFLSGGVPIIYDAFVPRTESAQRFPLVIGLHGSAGGHASMSEPASMLASHGFAVYVLHYFDRTGTTGVADKQTAIRNFPVWGKTVWDAISHAVSQPAIDPESIGLLGFSLGAYLALSVAAVDARVKAVVEFFGGMPKEMSLFMRRLCPTLILHGDQDATVPVSEARHLQQLLEKESIPYEVQIYSGAGHGFTGEIWDDACRRTLSFLQRYLLTPSV